MNQKTIPFVIDHLDPMGQGVSKRSNDKKQSTITFTPKTLPGERGVARVLKSSKGVEFAELANLETISPQRIEPECPHYTQCSGCDYLHVSYVDEVQFKKNALLFLLRQLFINNKNITDSDIEVIAASERFGYRNRVQLHYRHKYLGLISTHSEQVLEVPQCRLVSVPLKKAMQQLYADKSWTDQYSGRGHVEIYERDGEVAMNWNLPYAHGGFSQVNTRMNEALKKWLSQYFEKINFNSVLDLFSGDGNLSDDIVRNKTLQRQMVDMSPINNDNYLQLDLYGDGALASFQRRARCKQADVLLLDPPRKGFPALAEWVNFLKPKYIAYVSCNPATLARDLKTLLAEQKKTSYTINNIVLLDMFPGTHHFETIVLLKAA